MTDIFEEVDESLRQDKAAQLWGKYAPWLYAIVVLAIGGVGANEFLKWQRSQDIEKAAQVYDAGAVAMEKKDFAAARTAFAKLQNDQTGFAELTGHMLAGVEKAMTNDPAAISQHLADAAAKDKGGLLGDVAILKMAYAKADTATLAELEAIVKPLVDKGGYAASLAREVVAAKALASGDIDRARTDYQALSLEIEAPQAMKQRVQQVLLTLPARTPAAATAPAATTPPAPAAAQPPAQPGKPQ